MCCSCFCRYYACFLPNPDSVTQHNITQLRFNERDTVHDKKVLTDHLKQQTKCILDGKMPYI